MRNSGVILIHRNLSLAETESKSVLRIGVDKVGEWKAPQLKPLMLEELELNVFFPASRK